MRTTAKPTLYSPPSRRRRLPSWGGDPLEQRLAKDEPVMVVVIVLRGNQSTTVDRWQLPLALDLGG